MRVFISSSVVDLHEYRDAVYRALRRLNLDVDPMENWSPRTEDPQTASLQAVEATDVLICLVGWRYGTVPAGQPVHQQWSITEQEYHKACDLKKEVLVFLGDDTLRNAMPPSALSEGPVLQPTNGTPAEPALTRFRRHLATAHVVKPFHADPEALAVLVRESLLEHPTLAIFDPQAFYVPIPRGTVIGREEALTALHDMLTFPHRAARARGAVAPPVAVTGLSGVGKSMLAVEYAYRHHRDWRGGLFWLNAANLDLIAELAGVARQLRLGGPADPNEALAHEFAARVRERFGETLLILDNVDHPESVLNRQLVPGVTLASLGCQILLTSRRGDLRPADFNVLPLNTVTPHAALALLLKGLHQVLAAPTTDPQRVAAQEICRRVGHLPQLLTIAGAYLESERSDVAPLDYLGELERVGILAASEYAARWTGSDSMWEVLQVTWQRLAHPDVLGGNEARAVLRIAAQFPESMTLSQRHLEYAGGAAIADKPSAGALSPLRAGLRRLKAINFIEELPENQYRLHPIVRDFALNVATESDSESGGQFAAQVCETFVSALCKPAHLNDRLSSGESIYAILSDFVVARRMCKDRQVVAHRSEITFADSSASSTETWWRALEAWHRCLDREAYAIASSTQGEISRIGLNNTAFVWQQIRNRAVEYGLAEITSAVDDWLRTYVEAPWLRLIRVIGSHDTMLIRRLPSEAVPTPALAWHPSGEWLATSDWDGPVHVWSADSGAEELTLDMLGTSALALAWHPSGALLASGAHNGAIHFWATQELGALNPTPDALMDEHSSSVTALIWSFDGNLLACGRQDGSIQVYRLEPDSADHIALTCVWQASNTHRHGVSALVWDGGGDRLASAGGDSVVTIWSGLNGKKLADIPQPAEAVQALAWRRVDHMLAAAGEDGFVRIWTCLPNRKPSLVSSVSVEAGISVFSLAWSPDGVLLASGTDNGLVRLFAEAPQDSGRSHQFVSADDLIEHSEPVIAASFSPSGHVLTTVGQGRNILMWSVQVAASQAGPQARSESKRTASNADRSQVSALGWTPDGSAIAFGTASGEIVLFNPGMSTVQMKWKGHPRGVNALAWSPNGRYLATGGGAYDETVRVWSLTSGVTGIQQDEHPPVGRTVGFHGDAIRALAWSPDGHMVATAGMDEAIFLWDAADAAGTYRERAALRGQAGVSTAIAWSPDGKTLASGGIDGAVRVWREQSERHSVSWQATPMERRHRDAVTCVGWSTRDGLLASGGEDGEVNIWYGAGSDDSAGIGLASAKRVGETVTALAWHPRLLLLAVATNQPLVSLWEVVTDGSHKAAMLTVALACPVAPHGIQWSPDGQNLLICAMNSVLSTVRVYEVSLERYIPSRS